MSTYPIISVVIPVYNGEKYLMAAIEGIKRQNISTEILIVDDASSDRSREIAQTHADIFIANDKNLGPIESRRIGMKQAKGKYLFFHDQDDLLCDNALPVLARCLEENHNLSVVFAQRKDFLSADAYGTNEPAPRIKADAYWGAVSGAALLRASDFIGSSLFLNEYNTISGEAFYLQKFAEEHDLGISKLPFTASMRRIHGNNYSIRHSEDHKRDFMKLLRSKLERETSGRQRFRLAGGWVGIAA
ncbi:MAG: glycosyltransferase family 2 protein [Desulfovibrio sp.]|nr:glycosyltransferase family 2 protein [Desulfovibrio sp.]